MRAAAGATAHRTSSVAELDEGTQFLALYNCPAIYLTVPRAVHKRWLLEYIRTWLCRTFDHPISLSMLGVDHHLELGRLETTEYDQVKIGLAFGELLVAFKHFVVKRDGAGCRAGTTAAGRVGGRCCAIGHGVVN